VIHFLLVSLRVRNHFARQGQHLYSDCQTGTAPLVRLPDRDNIFIQTARKAFSSLGFTILLQYVISYHTRLEQNWRRDYFSLRTFLSLTWINKLEVIVWYSVCTCAPVTHLSSQAKVVPLYATEAFWWEQV
jgi:hypothetical protein